MMAQEYGTCEVCGKDGVLVRTYYHHDFKCECHSPQHFEIVSHCADCVPRPPETTVVYAKPIEE